MLPWDLACERNWLRMKILTAGEKSAEGIVGEVQSRRPERFPKGIKREEQSVVEGRESCIRPG